MITCVVLAASQQTKLVLARLFRSSIGVLLILYGFQGLSALWSAMPEYSAFRAIEVISQFIAVVVGISCFTTFPRAEKTVVMLGLLVALLGMAGILKLTSFSSFRTNQYTAGASMVLCYCFAEIPQALGRRRTMLIRSAVVSLIIVAAGQCSSANVATVLGLLVAAILSRMRRALFLIVIFGGLTLILVPAVTDGMRGVIFPGKSESELRNLHGRIPMWKESLSIAAESPLIGHGFAVQNRVSDISVHTHNTYVQVFLDTGAVGVALFTFSILLFLREVLLRRYYGVVGLAGSAAAFTSLLVHSMGIPIIGAQWLAPTFTVAAFAGLYGCHVHSRADFTPLYMSP